MFQGFWFSYSLQRGRSSIGKAATKGPLRLDRIFGNGARKESAETTMILVFILAVVSFTTVFFGGIHAWAQSLMILSIFGITAAALWAWAINKAFKRDDQAAKVILDPVSISGILFLLWAGFQLIPLPDGILQFLSPSTKAAWQTTGIVGGKGPFPISL